MKLTLGENIRTLRREKNITQEDFSVIFGVSYQSVSRWENGTCYPDMELLPDIAEYFGITVDKLIGADKNAEQKEVNRYLDLFQEAVSTGAVYECIDIAREGIKEYPNNYALLNKLMYALFISGDDDGNVAEWKENMAKFDAEITELGERIMKYCPDQDIRLEATARLAFNHCQMGRKEIGRAIYESLPTSENCRENAIWWALEENEKESFLKNKIKQDYETLRSSVWLLASSECLSDEEAITITDKVFALENLIGDGQIIKNGWGHSRLYFEMAKYHIRLGDTKNALINLRYCADYAKAFDERPEEQTYTCLLFGTVTQKRNDFETADTRSLCEIAREKWLMHSDFDSIRDTDGFKEIIKLLS